MRIINISEKYKKRPSKILGIEDNVLSFFFDEAADYILSMKDKREVKKNGRVYLEEYWIKEPKWSDKNELNIKRANNNSELIAEMKANLEKYKY
ncbi:hypothetical protein [uncultured Clostridium sp.]|uniref:hypothetical protein n=2 Tax=uncultured Clostridium sp. TaxID=59620 RepID=UPI002606E7AA|nr:hypothetical protein [uncultured Clostridium sp.]